jgi:hypothetical protein
LFGDFSGGAQKEIILQLNQTFFSNEFNSIYNKIKAIYHNYNILLLAIN